MPTRTSSFRSASSRGCSADCFWSTFRRQYHAGQLQFFGNQAALADPKAFKTISLRWPMADGWSTRSGHSAAQRPCWPTCHAIPTVSPSLTAASSRSTSPGSPSNGKDYRAGQQQRSKVMTLATDEFIRRFLIHVLPSGFHRIRHHGLFANGGRAANIACFRQLLNVPTQRAQPQSHDTAAADDGEPNLSSYPCPCCGGRMIIIETFDRGCTPRHRPTRRIRIDNS